MIPPRVLFDWYPLAGMVGADLVNDESRIDALDPHRHFHLVLDRQLVALLKPRRAGQPPVRVPIPPRVVVEMQHGDRMNPIFTLHRDDPDNWGRIQGEINTAAERVAERTDFSS